jgi:UDP-N-acetyl-D-galactosamine dehydrogenase
VDPYYLTFKAESLGYHPEVILAGRRINDNMGAYVAKEVVKLLIKKSHKVDGARVLVLGITFKENCPDIRNSRVIDVISELKDFGCNVDVYDPWADDAEVKHEYGIGLCSELSSSYDAVVLAVAHSKFKELDIKKLAKEGGVIYDIKGFLPKSDIDARV